LGGVEWGGGEGGWKLAGRAGGGDPHPTNIDTLLANIDTLLTNIDTLLTNIDTLLANIDTLLGWINWLHLRGWN
jgi:hypothetical protein